tara:strand:+ start:427 stop:1101 length:675 start_codon:yes stop_codon:yes gene_type:complete
MAFFINLDTAIERRLKFMDSTATQGDKDYKRWRATPREEVPELIDHKMLSMYNFGRDAHLARCGCFISHVKLLEHIVENQLLDVLILEDDAIQVNPLPLVYPRDSIVYVGGFIYNRKMMDESKVLIDHSIGMNLCPPEYRILGTVSYIIPDWRVALDILDRIKSQKRYKAIDIMLGNIGLKQYYNYPGSFREEGSISQISSKNKIQTENYEFITLKKYNSKYKE